MAPTIGPTLGGWMTDNYSWRWIFYINLPVGLLTLFLVMRLVEDPPYLSPQGSWHPRRLHRHRTADAGGRRAADPARQRPGGRLVRVAIYRYAGGGLGACFISLVVWEWRHKSPIVDVRLFKNVNFAVSSLMMFSLGILLFSSLVMMPLFLQTLMGYTAESAGPGSFRRRRDYPVRDAHRRPAHDESPGEIHHGLWLVVPHVRDVLFRPAIRPAD